MRLFLIAVTSAILATPARRDGNILLAPLGVKGLAGRNFRMGLRDCQRYKLHRNHQRPILRQSGKLSGVYASNSRNIYRFHQRI